MVEVSTKVRTPLDVVQRWYATSDPVLLLEQIDWQVLDSFPSGGCYRGRAEVFDSFFPAVQSRFRSYQAKPDLVAANGDIVLVTGTYVVESLSGQYAKIAFAHIWTVHEETIVSFRQIADTAAINAMLA